MAVGINQAESGGKYDVVVMSVVSGWGCSDSD